MTTRTGLGLLMGSLLFLFIAAPNAAAQNCNYWYASVGVKNADARKGFKDETNSENIVEGIECLLRLQGDKSRGAFSGASDFSGPIDLPEATVEICALYYISKLFYGKYAHARGVALRFRNFDVDKSINSDAAVQIAFNHYRCWFEKIKKIGLADARLQKLDPLADSPVRWY